MLTNATPLKQVLEILRVCVCLGADSDTGEIICNFLSWFCLGTTTLGTGAPLKHGDNQFRGPGSYLDEPNFCHLELLRINQKNSNSHDLSSIYLM